MQIQPQSFAVLVLLGCTNSHGFAPPDAGRADAAAMDAAPPPIDGAVIDSGRRSACALTGTWIGTETFDGATSDLELQFGPLESSIAGSDRYEGTRAGEAVNGSIRSDGSVSILPETIDASLRAYVGFADPACTTLAGEIQDFGGLVRGTFSIAR